MKLFQNLFSKGAPCWGLRSAGELVSIKDVSDPTFGEEIVGKGVAIIPSENRICAPADGKVATVFPTGHAVALVTEDGAEILIHVGLDTVKLNGKHFTIHVAEEQEVKKGDLLLEADMEQIKAEGYDIITPMVVCNTEEFSEIVPEPSRKVASGDDVLKLHK